jgi:hypothetical protein
MKTIVLIIYILLLNVNGSFAQEYKENSLFKTFKKITELDQSHIRKNNIPDSLILLNFFKIKELLSSDISLNSEQKLKNKTKKKLELPLISKSTKGLIFVRVFTRFSPSIKPYTLYR